MQPPAKTDDILLPAVKVGEKLPLIEILPTQHFTSPPARYSEASLVKELESLGIGRPSTYASIISTIQERGYVKLENKRLYAEKMGDIVTERLVESFPDLMDYAFTAGLEDKLDEVAVGEEDWKTVLDRFYHDFKQSLIMPKPPMACVPIIQPMCLIFTVIYAIAQCRYAQVQSGVFLGCTGYNLPPKERCKGTKNLMPVSAFEFDADDDSAEVNALMEKKRCPKCNTAMDGYIVDGGLKLHISVVITLIAMVMCLKRCI